MIWALELCQKQQCHQGPGDLAPAACCLPSHPSCPSGERIPVMPLDWVDSRPALRLSWLPSCPSAEPTPGPVAQIFLVEGLVSVLEWGPRFWHQEKEMGGSEFKLSSLSSVPLWSRTARFTFLNFLVLKIRTIACGDLNGWHIEVPTGPGNFAALLPFPPPWHRGCSLPISCFPGLAERGIQWAVLEVITL